MASSETRPHAARIRFAAGPIEMDAAVRITSGGLLAIGALVSGIILSVAPLVWTATNVARRRVAKDQAS